MRVVGLAASATGIGKSARLCAEQLARSGVEISVSDLSRVLARDDGIAIPAVRPPSAAPTVSIFVLNPPMLLAGVLASGLATYQRTYNVGYWAWELEMLPADWVAGLPFLDAIFVPSEFCQKVVARYTTKPVVTVPHPLTAPHTEPRIARIEQPFRVLSVFNYGSSYERKNPDALIAAFRAAFGQSTDAELILKTADGARHPQQQSRLHETVGDAPNISVIDAVWPESKLTGLFRSADVYASLHRSEGFGLTLAEAILEGLPVVATDWSGNTDFCDPDASFPVSYTLTPLRDAHTDYDGLADARWAEPSIESAATQLKYVKSNLGVARARAATLKQRFMSYLERTTYRSALEDLRTSEASAR